MSEPVEIFIAYAHKDKAYLEDLTKHLHPLKRQKFIQVWSDADIESGTVWEKAIDTHLETAQVFLLLISADFMASDYCYSIEMNRAVERHERGEARVIPIILGTIPSHAWETAPFGKLQALPKDAKPIKSWREKDEAYASIVDGIHKAIEHMTTKPSLNTPVPFSPAPLGEPASSLPGREVAVEKISITSSNSTPQTASSLRLRRLDARDAPPIIETHERLITIGRGSKNFLRIEDEFVSWCHGQIIFQAGGYYYHHLSDKSRSILRRKGLERLFRGGKNEEIQLRNQDRLTIGATTFIVEFDLINEDTDYTTTESKPEDADAP